jgi:RNA polymerase sigma factor (sigma-70 family)
MPEPSLESLVENASAGDVGAFAILVKRFRAAALAQARRRLDDASLIEDVVQESFLIAYTNLRARELREASAFGGWLRTIVRHQCARITRRRSVTREVFQEDSMSSGEALNALEQVEKREVQAEIRRVVALLPDGHRRVVYLYHLDDKPAWQIAEEMDLPLTTVKKRLVDGRRKMKERLLMEMNEGIENEMTFRRPSADDWASIGATAKAALPHAGDQNELWLENRRNFNEQQFQRRHYIAEDSHTGKVIAYGAVECASEPGRFRLFLVMDPALLPSIGTRVYEKLMEALKELNAEAIWVREFADDQPLLDFLLSKGLEERYRYHVPEVGDLVVLKREF